MKLSMSWILVLLCLTAIYAERVAVLPDIFNPGDIQVGDKYIYVVQEAEVFLYSMEDYRLVRKFGRRGEGPREFILSDDNMVFISVQPDYLLVNSVKRMSYFTVDGRYLRERHNSAGLWMEPLGSNFVGIKRVYDPDGTRRRKLTLFNDKLELVKTVYQEFDGIQPRRKIIEAVTWPTSNIYRVYAGRIYVADKERTIHVYDRDGKPLYDIDLPFPRIKVDAAVREKYLRFYREEEQYWRVRWDRLKSWFRLPEALPVISTYQVNDDCIYILTHQTYEGKDEILVLDLKGNLKRRAGVSLNKFDQSIFNIFNFDISGGRLYQYAENSDTEEYEMHIFDLK
jgi:hypothetical protein